MSVESLAWFRADPIRWASLDYVPARDEDGYPDDANRGRRTAVIEMLGHDLRPSDAEFLRYLLRQEIAMHAAGWGYGDALSLVAVALAGMCEVSDVWLLWHAKTANFDTFTALDTQLLFAAGVAKTLAFVRESDHPERDGLLRFVDSARLDDEDIRAWIDGMRRFHEL